MQIVYRLPHDRNGKGLRLTEQCKAAVGRFFENATLRFRRERWRFGTNGLCGVRGDVYELC